MLATSPLMSEVITRVHGADHEGIEKTLHRLRVDFFIPGARVVVHEHVWACATCQCNMAEQLHLADLLQPLTIPMTVWVDNAMDFIEGLPHVHDKFVILMVVNLFCKSAHFITLGQPYPATSVACAFFDTVVCPHDTPNSIVSDHELVFTSTFWWELF
jgi:hypothetical protein